MKDWDTIHAALFMLAATLLIGVGYLAVLPPFEGFDEYAYYSAIRQVADTGILPIYGHSFIDQSALDYENYGPMPWASGNPPFDRTGQLTYPSFFANPSAVAHYKQYRLSPNNKPFTPSSEQNWESQHPPLYYLVMTPIMRATEQLPFVTQIFLLRLSSYILAWAGLTIGWRATKAYTGKTIPNGVATAYLYLPLVVPMFFGEFARIGSDSLCLFIVALTYSLSLDIFSDEKNGLAKPSALGVLLGFGLLTKAFFLPISAGYALFTALRAWQAHHDRELFRCRLMILGATALPALLLGGGWYLYDFVTFGSPTGSTDSIFLAQHGGLIANLMQKFSIGSLARDMIGIAVTWSWAGSWSLAHISPLLHGPLLLFTFWLAASYGLFARHCSMGDSALLPVWMLAPFLAGLLYHVLVVLALGSNGTPGWYLNILAPFLALAMGCGIERIRKSSYGTHLLGLGSAYAMFFLVAALWSQLALFAGCAIKSTDKLYGFSDARFCLDKLPQVTNHLSVFGWPSLAFAGIGGGVCCFIIGSTIDFLGRRKIA